jgi:diguanylate cyclase (GGDEF)-like protein
VAEQPATIKTRAAMAMKRRIRSSRRLGGGYRDGVVSRMITSDVSVLCPLPPIGNDALLAEADSVMHAVPIPGRDLVPKTAARPPADVIADAARLASEISEAPFAVVALVGPPLQIEASFGFDAADDLFDRGLGERILDDDHHSVVVRDAVADLWLREHPLVARDPGARFLVAVKLHGRDGDPLGFLMALGPEPRSISEEQVEALEALGRLVSAHLELRGVVGKLEHAVTERDRYEQWLEDYQLRLEQNLAEVSEQSLTDPLTGMRNRRAFVDRLDEDLRRCSFEDERVTLVLLDVDEFKSFNDEFGHPAGDTVLTRVATLFTERIRSTDFVARIGGDEFAMVLRNTDAEGGYVLAERLRRAVERATWPLRQVTISAGVASAALGTSADLMAAADRALYASKARGRNRVEVHPG